MMWPLSLRSVSPVGVTSRWGTQLSVTCVAREPLSRFARQITAETQGVGAPDSARLDTVFPNAGLTSIKIDYEPSMKDAVTSSGYSGVTCFYSSSRESSSSRLRRRDSSYRFIFPIGANISFPCPSRAWYVPIRSSHWLISSSKYLSACWRLISVSRLRSSRAS